MELLACSNRVKKPPEQPARKPVVFLIEEDDDLRFLFKTALEMQDLDVIEGTRMGEVIHAAKWEHVDLVLMDYGCSPSACLDTLRSIRQEFPQSKLPIFVLSSYAETTFQEQAHAAGCNQFFVQPVDVFNLGKAIENQIYNESDTNRLTH
jgi:DNA-binding response OmpR family regulator